MSLVLAASSGMEPFMFCMFILFLGQMMRKKNEKPY
jgi:hypothetical protein